MKILKAVAFLMVGASLVSSGWCNLNETDEVCKKENNAGPCQQSVKTRGKCNYEGSECRVKCNLATTEADCHSVKKKNGTNRCKWHGPASGGLCRPN